MCPLPHDSPMAQRMLRLRAVNDLPSCPQLSEACASKWLRRKGLSRSQPGSLLQPCMPTWDVPWVSRAVCGGQGRGWCEDVHQVQDGGLLEEGRGNNAQRGWGLEEGRALTCHPHSSSFFPLFIPQTSINDPLPPHSAFQFPRHFLIQAVPHLHNNLGSR